MFENFMCPILTLILFPEKLYCKWDAHSSNVIEGKIINDSVSLKYHNWASSRSSNLVGVSFQDRGLDKEHSVGVSTGTAKTEGQHLEWVGTSSCSVFC